MENPINSLLWHAPSFKKLLEASSTLVLDFCQYGTAWRKRTRWVAWRSADLSPLRRLCSGRGGVCSRTGAHHTVLEGYDAVNKCLRTQTAAQYPTELCTQLARKMKDTCFNLRVARLSQLSG